MPDEEQARLDADSIIADQQALIEDLKTIVEGQEAEISRISGFGEQLAAARSHPVKVLHELTAYHLLSYLSSKLAPFSSSVAARFARSARKRAPTRSIETAPVPARQEPKLQRERTAAANLDSGRKAILVVCHEASRSGAPILALNLIERLSARYNVISLLLRDGELTDHFRQESASVYLADRVKMSRQELDGVIHGIVSRHPLMFALVNSAESWMALRALTASGVPTVSLIHEFPSYTRPHSAFPDMIARSTETVFSTRATLDNAISDFLFEPGPSIHVVPQGKCTVPANSAVRSQTVIDRANLTSILRPAGSKPRFLVIGVGDVIFRKGVDLFIECATILKNRPGGERFQFVWIGSGFDPERELDYSVYLEDQMKRAELGSQMKFLNSTSQIEFAYQEADLLLVSSRLDPLPNVAIDSLTLGLPVICFDKTTGIADFLKEIGIAQHCVAEYLNPCDLARKVEAFADSEDLRAHVSERSRMAAKSTFDMDTYALKIESIAIHAVGQEDRVKEDVNTILASGKFRSDFFVKPNEAMQEQEAVEEYVRRATTGLGIRKPMPGFHPTVYSEAKAPNRIVFSDPFADFLRNGLPRGPWLQSVIQNDSTGRGALAFSSRVALHIHVFYRDQLDAIAERLRLNASAPDLFISVSSDDAIAATREALSEHHGRIADIKVAPNLGRNLGPLLTLYGRELCASYDIVGHLHTKKSAHLNSSFSESWSAFLFENLIGGKRGGAMTDLILSSMESHPGIGIVMPDDPHVLAWTANRQYADELAVRMNLGELPEQFNFPIGAMFWMRSEVLAKFVELGLEWEDYAPEPLPSDGTVLHAIERLFGVAPATMGMACAVTNVRGLSR